MWCGEKVARSFFSIEKIAIAVYYCSILLHTGGLACIFYKRKWQWQINVQMNFDVCVFCIRTFGCSDTVVSFWVKLRIFSIYF